MTQLYLVRHGETVDNVKQIMQGQMQGQLNEEGIRQAGRLSEELAATHFDAIIASDLQRSIDTATIIAAPHHLQVVTTPLLRERDWGKVESVPQMKERARQFLQLIRKRYPNQRVLAVGHGIINKAVQSVYYDKPMNEIAKMNNAEIRILEL